MSDFILHESIFDEETGITICFYRIPEINKFKTVVYIDSEGENDGECS